jgi:hypothetical protein
MLKRYNGFILEKLGVPDGIIESSKILFENIINCFKLSIDDEVTPDPGTKKCNFSTNLESPIKIGDLELNNIQLIINVYFDDKFENPDVMSWGVGQPSTNGQDVTSNKLILDKDKFNKLILIIDFISKEGNKFSKLLDKLESEKEKNIGIISHELKHFYDGYMMGSILATDLIDYNVWSNFRTGIKQIDRFLFYLYFTSKTESLVRSAEVAGEIDALGLKKSEFKEHLMGTILYQTLIEMKNFSFNKMRSDMLNNIEEIKKIFDGIPDDETDEYIIDSIINSMYDEIIVDKSKKMISMIDPTGFKSAIGILKSEEIDFYNNYIKSRIFKSGEDFFVYWQKKINFEANKVIKKISKLIDMCQDDKVNPIMDKINKRADGKCIIKPELYDKFVLNSKNEKFSYKRRG